MAVKDGLSELHSRLVRRTSTLAHLVEMALNGPQQPVAGADPLARLPVPIGRTARLAAQLIGDMDRAATELFEGDWQFRRLDFRPRPYLDLLDHPGEAEAEYFTKLHYWACRHLLHKWDRGGVRILLRGLLHSHADATRRVELPMPLADAVMAPVLESLGPPTARERNACAALLALNGQAEPPILEFDDGQDDESRRQLTLRCALTVVVATEIASAGMRVGGSEATMEVALEIADEVVGGQLTPWEDALRSALPLQRLAQQLRFTLRYL